MEFHVPVDAPVYEFARGPNGRITDRRLVSVGRRRHRSIASGDWSDMTRETAKSRYGVGGEDPWRKISHVDIPVDQSGEASMRLIFGSHSASVVKQSSSSNWSMIRVLVKHAAASADVQMESPERLPSHSSNVR